MIDMVPTRDYSLYFEHRPEYLYVHVETGEISYETTRRYWNEIVSMQHRRNYTRILVDNDIANELATHELFTFVSELAGSGLGGVTFVIRPRKYEPHACEFEEMVGTNRGLKLKVCGTIDNAEHWIVH
jgi:hypothetical protein